MERLNAESVTLREAKSSYDSKLKALNNKLKEGKFIGPSNAL